MLITSPALAGTTFDTLELAPPTFALPAHDGVAVSADGWEPDRVEKALLTALTDPLRGTRHEKLIPRYDVQVSGPNAQPVTVLAEGDEPSVGTLILEVTAREPVAEDKLQHRRRRYDHQWKIIRRTELRIDFQVVDPGTGNVLASSSVSRTPKKEPSEWHTDESGAIASAATATEMAFEVLDDAAREIADAVAPRWSRRKYGFAGCEHGKDVVVEMVETRRVRDGARKLLQVAELHPSEADDQFNAALVLALVKDFEGAEAALKKARALDDKAPYKKLAEKLPEWRREYEALVAAGFPVKRIDLEL